MRNFKRLLPVVLILACCAISRAQSTSVTLQVTDAASQSWNNGSWQAQLVPGSGSISGVFTISGSSTPVPNQLQTGSLNGTGGASITLTPNASISPSGSVWKFTVATVGGSSSYQTNVTIAGASQNVTLQPPTWT